MAQVIGFLTGMDGFGKTLTHLSGVVDQISIAPDHCLHQVSSEFIPGRQQDASLFLMKLLEHGNQCLTASERRLSDFEEQLTVIDQIFGIEIRSIIRCLSCSSQTEKIERNHMLFLEVNEMKSLNIALKHFFQAETLSDGNAYQCENCRDLVNAEKKLNIHKSPPILLINLKRGVNNGNNIRKLVHEVQYYDTLDVSAYQVDQSIIDTRKKTRNNNSNQDLYHLYAVLIHTGVHLHTGHYFAYVRTKGNAWVMINDTQCRQVSLADVLNHRSAYVLFYAHASDLTDTNRLVSVVDHRSNLKRSKHCPHFC